METDTEAPAEQTAALRCSDCSLPTQSVITATGQDRYRVEQQVLLDAPLGQVWAQLGALDRFFQIALPNATELQWVSGNGKNEGDELNFVLDGALIRLSVVTRDRRAHVFQYRLIEPALGIEELESRLELRRCGNQTELYWVRNFRMGEGVSFDPLTQVVAEEFANIIERFAP